MSQKDRRQGQLRNEAYALSAHEGARRFCDTAKAHQYLEVGFATLSWYPERFSFEPA
jgi:hypothetical protein